MPRLGAAAAENSHTVTLFKNSSQRYPLMPTFCSTLVRFPT
jgi:hypothetical protein